MPIYEYNGVHYDLDTTNPDQAIGEIEKFLGTTSTRRSGQPPKPPYTGGEDSYAKRIFTEGVTGVANVGIDSVLAAPAGLYGIYRGVKEGSMDAAEKGLQEGMDRLQEVFPRFRGPSAEVGTAALNEGLDTLVQGAGSAAVGIRNNIPTSPLNLFSEEGVRGTAETAANLFGDPAAAAAFVAGRGARPRPRILEKTPEDEVVRKAQEIAAANGRTYVTPDDIRAAEQGTTGMRQPTEQPELDLGAAYKEGELMDQWRQQAQDERAGMVRDDAMARERASGISDMFDPYTDPLIGPDPVGRPPKRDFDTDLPYAPDPNAAVRGLTDVGVEVRGKTRLRRTQGGWYMEDGSFRPDNTIEFERGVGNQSEMFPLPDRQPGMDWNVSDAAVPNPRIRPMDDQGYIAPTDQMHNEGAVQGELPFYPDHSTEAVPTNQIKPHIPETKVVDAEGNPVVVYHGTSKDKNFKNIEPNTRGAWFTENPEQASKYAQENDSRGYKWENGKTVKTNTADRVIPVYLDIKNPYTLTPEEHSRYQTVENYAKFQREITAKAKVAGYDGIRWPDKSWSVFDRKQIHSALSPEVLKQKKAEAVSQKVASAFDEANSKIEPAKDYTAELAVLVDEGDFRGALDHIRANSPNKFYRWLADVLLLDEHFKPKLVVYDYMQSKSEGKYASGRFVSGPDINEIQLSRAGGFHGSEWALLHEAVHARVMELQWRHDAGVSVPTSVKTALSGISKLYEFVKPHLTPEQQKMYGMRDVYEFMAEGFTNNEFQRALEGVVLPDGFISSARSSGLLNAFKGFIHHVVNVLKNMGFAKVDNYRNALTVLLNEGSLLLRETGYDPKVAKVAYGPAGMDWHAQITRSFEAPAFAKKAQEKNPDTFSEYKRKLEGTEGKAFADRYAKPLYDQYLKNHKEEWGTRPTQPGYDNRAHDDFRKDLVRPDGSQRVDDVGILPISNAYNMAEKHPILRRVYDQVSQATNFKDILYHKWFRGAGIERGMKLNPLNFRMTAMGTARRTESPDSLAVLKKRIKPDEGAKILRVIELYRDTYPERLEDATLLRASGISTNGVKYLKALISVTRDQMLPEMNKVFRERGLAEIESDPTWIMSKSRYGAYQVRHIGEDGKHTYLRGLDNYADAEKLAKHLKANGMDVYVDTAASNPKNLEVLPHDAWVQALASTEDKVARDRLQQVASDAARRLGITKHALTRDSSAKGYAGSLEILDALGPEKAWESFNNDVQKYIRQVANYVGSADANKRVGEMLVDHNLKTMYPNAMDKARYMWDQYKGVPRFGDNELRKISRLVAQLPIFKSFMTERSGHNALSSSAMAFTSSLLVWHNPTFYLANALQYYVVPSRLTQLKERVLDGKGDVTTAMLKAEAHMHWPTAETKQIIATALENRSLEASFAEALDWSMSSEDVLPKWTKYALGEKMAAYADSYSRGISYLAHYEMGKSAGLNEAKAHEFAARETQGLMGQYDRWARMPVLNQLGPVGDAIAPLTTFISNMVARLADYTKHAVVGDEGKRLVAPLMTLLSLQIAISGVKGLPFYQDAEKLYMELNKYMAKRWGWEIQKNPSEWLADLQEVVGPDMREVIEYGVPSYLSGVNMSNTLGMGTVIGNVGQTAGVTFAWDAVTAWYDSVEDYFLGRRTKVEAFQEVTKMFPGTWREWMRNYYTNTETSDPFVGSTVYSGEQNIYTRNPKEQLGALLTGKHPIGETRARDSKYTQGQYELAVKEQREQARDKIAELALSGKPWTRYVENVIEVEPQILENIEEAIEERMMRHNIPYATRQVLKNKANARLMELTQRMNRAHQQ